MHRQFFRLVSQNREKLRNFRSDNTPFYGACQKWRLDNQSLQKNYEKLYVISKCNKEGKKMMKINTSIET